MGDPHPPTQSGQETPDKTVCVKSKVTPNGENDLTPVEKGKKDSKNSTPKIGKDSKKQTSLTSFFFAPVTKKKSKKKQSKATTDVSEVKKSSKKTISIEPPLMTPCKIPKPNPLTGDKESLREVVVGSVSSSLMSLEDASPEYEKCTSLPLTLAISRFNETSRERFLRKVNEAGGSKSPPVGNEDDVVVDASDISSNKCENKCELATEAKGKENTQEAKPTKTQPTSQDEIMENDDEKTVCFTADTIGCDESNEEETGDSNLEVMQPSTSMNEADDALAGESLVQPSMTMDEDKCVNSSVDLDGQLVNTGRKGIIEEEVMHQCEAEMSQSEEKAVGIIVPMTQFDEEDCVMKEAHEDQKPKLADESNTSTQSTKTDNSQCKMSAPVTNNTPCLKENKAQTEIVTAAGNEKATELSKDGRLSGSNGKHVQVTSELEAVNMNVFPEDTEASCDSKNIEPPKGNEKSALSNSKSESENTVPPERLTLIERNSMLRTKSKTRLQTLIDRVSPGIEEELFEMPNSSFFPAEEFNEKLSPQAVTKLACIVQER